MDPISIVSLSCNILQLVETGVKVAKCYSEHRNGEGVLQTLRDWSADLISATDELQKSINQPTGDQKMPPSEKALFDAGERCRAIAASLQIEARKVYVHKGGNGQKRRIFTASLKSSFRSTKIQRLEEELRRQRELLNTCILVDLRKQITFSQEQEDELNHRNQQIPEIQHSLADIKHGQARLEKLTAQEGLKNRDHITKEVQHLWSNLEQRSTDTHTDRLLNSLFFPEINVRREVIRTAFAQTFRWIFSDPNNTSSTWTDFSKWLESGTGFYWMSGKAGSGKSTLMRYILEHEQTKVELGKGAHGDPLILSFFFWKIGNERLQKSIEGLLRTLLFQLLKEFPKLALALGQDSEHFPIWTNTRLHDTFRNALEQVTRLNSCCIFIDALDEVEDKFEDLIHILFDVLKISGVKICVSSRPLNEFEVEFAKSAKLRLHELTQSDIYNYATETLRNEVSRHNVRIITENELHMLTNFIRVKASGVFLWACLACQSLRSGIMSTDSYIQLQERLKEMPPELEELYAHMLQRIRPVHKTEAVRYFKLLLDGPLKVRNVPVLNRKIVALVKLDVTGDPPDYLSDNEMEKRRRIIGTRVLTRTAGILELEDSLRFVHRTAQEFLLSSAHPITQEIANDKEWDAAGALASAYTKSIERILRNPDAVVSRNRLEVVMIYLRHSELQTDATQRDLLMHLISICDSRMKLIHKLEYESNSHVNAPPWFIFLGHQYAQSAIEEDEDFDVGSLFDDPTYEYRLYHRFSDTVGACAAWGLTQTTSYFLNLGESNASYLLACVMETTHCNGIETSMLHGERHIMGHILERLAMIVKLFNAGADQNASFPVSIRLLWGSQHPQSTKNYVKHGWWQMVTTEGKFIPNQGINGNYSIYTAWSLLLYRIFNKLDFYLDRRVSLELADITTPLRVFLEHGADAGIMLDRMMQFNVPPTFSLEVSNASATNCLIKFSTTVTSLFNFMILPAKKREEVMELLRQHQIQDHIQLESIAYWFGDPNRIQLPKRTVPQVKVQMADSDILPCLRCIYRNSYWDHPVVPRISVQRQRPLCERTRAFLQAVAKTIEEKVPELVYEMAADEGQAKQLLADGTWPDFPDKPYQITASIGSTDLTTSTTNAC